MCRRFGVVGLAGAAAPVVWLWLAACAHATVTATGEITPSPFIPDNGSSTELRIGVGNSPSNVDPRATVTVDGGSLLNYNQASVGFNEGFFGKLLVSGEGTLVTLRIGGLANNAALAVGRQGNGYASFTSGATLKLTSNSGFIVVGRDAGSIGEVLVDGANTFVDLPGNILLGDDGVGSMTISGGALVRTTNSDSSVILGDGASGSGYLKVDGSLTTLLIGDDLIVGQSGIGELEISNGGLVDADNSSSQATIGALGRVALSGGTLDVRDLNVNGYLGGYGTVRGQVDVFSAGDVEINAGERLDFHDSFDNSGAVTITGGEARLLDTATTSATGRWTLEEGVVRFSQSHTNNGVIASAPGTNNLHGAITNNGTVVVASESVAVFNDSYTDAGTTTVLARGNALFLADLTFTSNSLVALQVSGADGGGDSAQIEVAGAATLAGELALDIPANFAPTTSQSIPLLFADGGISGAFIPPVFPTIEGLDFGLVYGANSLSLDVQVDVVSGLEGDFNGDNVVDAADYAVWRNGLGTTFTQGDYDLWRANYGKTAAPTANSPTAAPAPCGLVCLLTAPLALAARRRRA